MTVKALTRPLILVTNDDGVTSPGLAAAVAALDPLGELLIIAPAAQQTSMGRSRSTRVSGAGHLFRRTVTYRDREWPGVAVNTSPALAVEHGLQELATRKVDLVVSGINYGENIGTCVTVSGTVGAALEAAERGIPAMAVSLELEQADYHTHHWDVDFSAAMHFTRLFASRLLACRMPFDVDALKIEVPSGATAATHWRVTRQDRLAYYDPVIYKRPNIFDGAARMAYRPAKGRYLAEGTDAFAQANGLVSVTPLSLDLTSRAPLDAIAALLAETESLVDT